MAISFECEACGKSFTVRDELAGKTGQCKQCGSRIVIPLESDSEPYSLDALAGEAAPEPEPLPTLAPRPGPIPQAAAKAPSRKPKKKAKSGNRLYGPDGYNGDATRYVVGVGLVIAWFLFRMILKRM